MRRRIAMLLLNDHASVNSDAMRSRYPQGLLPRNLDVDGRVSMTNLNGTLKARAGCSVKVLVLKPGGGGQANPSVLG